ncbi:MAG: cytochrome c [Bacteroidia bacterium]|nr:cytochrome c [Bacteroidia bacterium]
MKTLRFHHILLALLIAIVVILTMSIETVWTKRNLEFLPGMVYSVPVEGQTERWVAEMRRRSPNPVPGTRVAREETTPGVLPAEALSSTDSSAQQRLSAALPRGREVYDIFCRPCHGAAGAGDGEVAKRGYPPPPSLLAENALRLSDSALYSIIADGRGNMPQYRSQITPADIRRSILHIRSMQQTAGQTTGGMQ